MMLIISGVEASQGPGSYLLGAFVPGQPGRTKKVPDEGAPTGAVKIRGGWRFDVKIVPSASSR